MYGYTTQHENGHFERRNMTTKPNTTGPRQVEEAKQAARTVAINTWTTRLVRLGYAVKGGST